MAAATILKPQNSKHIRKEYWIVEFHTRVIFVQSSEPILPLTEVFDNYMQQDAHEFFNYLLNHVSDVLQGERAIFCIDYLTKICLSWAL